jgi:hypothetical protein
MEATTTAKIPVALDDGDRGRVPASIVQRYHAATGKR